MKNVTPRQADALRKRAAKIAGAVPRGILPEDTPEAEAVFRKAAGNILKRSRAAGACLVINSPEKTHVFCFGSARLRPKIPVTEHTCFRLASVSKLVMTFGFLSLCESGLLSLDTDISEFLGFPLRNPRFPDRIVTARMLLTHTAGLLDGGPYAAASPENAPLLSRLTADPACWTGTAPGSAFLYSNLGAGIAGLAMERVCGKPLDAVMQERVFTPLGIRAAYDPRRITPASDLADGYRVLPFPVPPLLRYSAAKLSARPPEPFDPERDYFAGAGRMITDAAGLSAILRLLASKQDTPILSAASLNEMRHSQGGRPGIGDINRGLNTAFLPELFPGCRPIGHQGVAYGMCAECFADPENGTGVGLMTSGIRLDRRVEPLVSPGFDLVALGFSAISK